MARPNKKLITALRRAATKLNDGIDYQWGHMGACNCGHVAQEITNLTKGEIHTYAMRGHGDWTEQVEAYCPTSDFPMDLVISEMIVAGFSLEDLMNLERLKDHEVLSTIPFEKRRALKHNSREDVALYLNAWANLLEEKLRSFKEERRMETIS
jgi:hypothetical protein